MAKLPWREIKQEWMLSRLANKPVTNIELAKRYKTSPGSIRNRSSEEKWAVELEQRMHDQETILTQMMVERSEKALDDLRKDFIGSEVEIRRRHAIVARGLQVKAVQRIALIPPEQLSARDAVAMLKLGLEEERRALGFPEMYVEKGSAPLNDAYNAEVVRMGDHEKVKTMGVAFLKLMQERMEEFHIVPAHQLEAPLEVVGNESPDDDEGSN